MKYRYFFVDVMYKKKFKTIFSIYDTKESIESSRKCKILNFVLDSKNNISKKCKNPIFEKFVCD